MGLSKLTTYKLGDLIEPSDERNSDSKYGIDDVKGISIKKIFIKTKADMIGVSLKPYLLVKPDYFAYVTVTSRNGEKITLAYNTSKDTYIVSSSYIVFRIKRPDLLLSKFLFMFFNRPEFDRYSRFNSWGSARETFSWQDLCDTTITLPDKTVQQKYVDIYDAMCENQKSYEKGLDDLKLTCDAYIDFAKNKNKSVPLSQIFEEVNLRNSENRIKNVLGIDINKQFMKTKASINSDDLAKYKEIKINQFAFSGMQTGRDETVRIALYTDEAKAVISPAYTVYKVTNESFLPSFLMIWFNRHEFDRKGWFYSDGSVRANLDNDRFFEMTVPQLPLKEQQAIVEVYCSYLKRKEIADKFACSVKNICPILIKGAIEEGKSVRGR